MSLPGCVFSLRCSHLLVSSGSAKMSCKHQCRQWAELNVSSMDIFIPHGDVEGRLELRIIASLWPLEIWFGIILKSPLMALFWLNRENHGPRNMKHCFWENKNLYTDSVSLFQVTLSPSWQQSAVRQNPPGSYLFLSRTITLTFDTFCN